MRRAAHTLRCSARSWWPAAPGPVERRHPNRSERNRLLLATQRRTQVVESPVPANRADPHILRHVSRRWRRGLLAGQLLWLVCAHARADEVASALYVRADTDHTTVVSPRVRGDKRLGQATTLDVTYAADIWTSASVDIRASASVRPVTEQRDELDLQIGHDLQDVRVHASYRFSSEHDYTSHGGSLGGSLDLANNAATLDASLHVIADTVGQSGNPSFARSLTTLDGTLSYTQVIDPMMLMQLTYELAHNIGYQASPYRFVGVGGTGFGCVGASLCLPERVPAQRTRHALALLIRRALSDNVSVGLTYRYYFDDWSLGSHTLLGELGWNLAEHTLLALRYRFYTQGAVHFYQRIYNQLDDDQWRTRDRELSKLSYHRAGAELEQVLVVRDGGAQLSCTLGVSGNLYRYADFVGLSEVAALEISAALLLQL